MSTNRKPSRARRPGDAKPRRPRRETRIEQVVRITGDENTHAAGVVLFPRPGAATVTDPDLWTPARLRDES